MKSIKIKRLIFLAALVIVAVLTGCPPADSGGADNGGDSKGDSVPGPTFKNLGIDVAEKKIIVFFNTDISGTPDASKISLKKGSITLKLTTDYTLTIEQGRLVMTLKVAPKENEQYTVELQGGAVQDANGKSSTANTSSNNKTLTVGIIPAITPDSLTFKANSNKILTLAFNTNIEIVAKAKIRVEVQTAGTRKFTAASATSMVDTKNKNRLELTLGTPATHGNVYKVTVGAGAIKATESNLANTGALSSSQTTWSTSPILDSANRPYILHNKLVATFNLSIAIKELGKVKVYKNPTTGNDGDAVPLVSSNVTVNSKNLLEITLPKAVVAGEVYRLKLEAGAVSEEGKTDNVNKVIAPKDRDITIGAAPALTTDPLSLGRQKIIVTFTAPIGILDKTKIKYQLAGTPTKPTHTPKVINTNQLEIPLNAPLANAQMYRIHLEAGALGGGKNTVSMGAIQPEDKDITVWLPVFTAVKPAFDSATQLSVSFPVAVAIVDDGSNIKVQKKDDKDDPRTAVDESSFRTVSSRTIKVDGTDKKKIKVTLTGGEKITPYTQVWKVEFPANTVKTTPGQIPNSGPLTTLESEKPRLTDLYSWEEVPPEGSKWKARTSHTSVVFNSKIWVLGGDDGNKRNDVWSSPDGKTWTESTPPGEATKDTDGGNGTAANWWTARFLHTSVVFQGKIWVLGGRDTNRLNDVWSSPDGATWTESKPPNDVDGNPVNKSNTNWWATRGEHTSVVFPRDGAGKKIWVIGGLGNDDYDDVWSSTDGSNWMEENANSGMGERVIYKHASAVFDDKIWTIGGSYRSSMHGNFVWSSPGGKTWTKAASALPSSINFSPRAVEYKDRLWSLGGNGVGTKVFLSSADPADGWTAEDTLPEAIRQTQAVVFKNRIWLLGGSYGGARTDKVWKMGPGTE